ncbi:hypothetical protein ACQ5SO_06610 [Rhodovulum sp. DZ06]|uniref:hypothetical protein n=1 Tax=Rhodovulum sp. DZ06 TaxID=3425126 RepID=UPI003D3313EC
MTLYISKSRSKKAFKSLLGNANHLIITALVGLEAVQRGCIWEAPPELRVAWSPKNFAASAKRSRRLVLDMALIRAVDAIDVYLRESVRKPALIQCSKLRGDLDSAGTSIFQKILAVEGKYAELDRLPMAIIFLMISWRNKSAHSEASFEVSKGHVSVLEDRSAELSERFSGLSSKVLLEGYKAARPVTFKEVASLINAAHHFIEDLDAELIRNLDTDRYLRDAIWNYLASTQRPGERAEEARKRRAVSVWGKDARNRGDAVVKCIKQLGFSSEAPSSDFYAVISGDLIKDLMEFTPQEVLSWARKSSDQT